MNPEDADMHISMRIYYKLGFQRGAYSLYGPSTFQHNIDELLNKSEDIYHIADNVINNTSNLTSNGNMKVPEAPGKYLVLYCHLKDFNKGYTAPFNAIEKGKALAQFLNTKYSNNSKE